MSPEDWLQARCRGEIVVHSHPGGLPWRVRPTGGCRCRVICRGGWSAGGRSVPLCAASLGGALSARVTDCYTLFRDAYHLGSRCRILRGRMTGGVTVRISIWIIWATGLYQVPLSAAHNRAMSLLCCFGSSVPNHAAIYCGDDGCCTMA